MPGTACLDQQSVEHKQKLLKSPVPWSYSTAGSCPVYFLDNPVTCVYRPATIYHMRRLCLHRQSC